MATCGPNRKKVKLDNDGESGFETRAKAKKSMESAIDEAFKTIASEGGCTGSCKQKPDKNISCIRVADEDDVAALFHIFKYPDGDEDFSYGWYAEGSVDSACHCATVRS
jgi:hypothetical protein